MGKRRRQEIPIATVALVPPIFNLERCRRFGRVSHPQRGAPVGVGRAVGRCRRGGGPRHRDRVGLRGAAFRRHRHRQRVGPDVEVQIRLALRVRVVVVRDGHRRRGVVLRRRQRHRVDPVGHRCRVGFGSAIEGRAQPNRLPAGRALQFQIAQRRVGGGGVDVASDTNLECIGVIAPSCSRSFAANIGNRPAGLPALNVGTGPRYCV